MAHPAVAEADAVVDALFDAVQLDALRAARRVVDPTAVASAQELQAVAAVVGRAQTALARRALARLIADTPVHARDAARRVVAHVERHAVGAVFRAPPDHSVLAAVRSAREHNGIDAPRLTLARWAADSRQRTREATGASRAYLDTGAELLDRVARELEPRKASLARIVRTEAAFTENAAANEVIVAFAATRPRRTVFKRWTERIDDATGRALDSRVAQDSFALHGQLADARGVFTMPQDQRVSPKLWGRTWRYPPNRPYDRAIVLPWQRGWPGGGWLLHGDQRLRMR